jgi:hypothetical protein
MAEQEKVMIQTVQKAADRVEGLVEIIDLHGRLNYSRTILGVPNWKRKTLALELTPAAQFLQLHRL